MMYILATLPLNKLTHPTIMDVKNMISTKSRNYDYGYVCKVETNITYKVNVSVGRSSAYTGLVSLINDATLYLVDKFSNKTYTIPFYKGVHVAYITDNYTAEILVNNSDINSNFMVLVSKNDTTYSTTNNWTYLSPMSFVSQLDCSKKLNDIKKTTRTVISNDPIFYLARQNSEDVLHYQTIVDKTLISEINQLISLHYTDYPLTNCSTVGRLIHCRDLEDHCIVGIVNIGKNVIHITQSNRVIRIPNGHVLLLPISQYKKLKIDNISSIASSIYCVSTSKLQASIDKDQLYIHVGADKKLSSVPTGKKMKSLIMADKKGKYPSDFILLNHYISLFEL